METYHKIQTVWHRDPGTKFKKLIEGAWSVPEFEYLADCQWTFTEKVDGTNIRVLPHNESIEYKGKTDAANIPPFLLETLRADLNHKLGLINATLQASDVCMYGEGYGNRIQAAGKQYRPDNGFVLFDIKVGGYWLRRTDVEEVAEKLGLDVAPIIYHGTLHDGIELVRQGFSSAWGNFPAEGLVGFPDCQLFDRHGNRIITKIKTRDF